MQIQPNIKTEYGRLRSVLVGIARKMGAVPSLEECYDARSYESVAKGVYPEVSACVSQMTALVDKLEELGIQVMRPNVLEGTNQVFTRDIGFVIDDQFILPNVIEDRADELRALDVLMDKIPSSNIIMMPSGCFAEGGDVMVHYPYVFVGVSDNDTYEKYTTSRTNYAGFDYLQDEFPGYEFKGFELLKDDTNPRAGSLHLDCAFQPLGDALLFAPHLFKNAKDVAWIEKHFGKDNIFYCSEDEAYDLHTNVFSVGPKEVIISASAERLKNWLEKREYTVHTIVYDEVVKMGGLLRCSTMPLERE